MSAQAARAPLARRAAKPLPATRTRPQLYVVRAVASGRSTLLLVGVVVLLLSGALIGNLVIMGYTTHVAGELQRTRDALSQTREAIAVDQKTLYERSASTTLVRDATRLGMVPGQAPGVVDLRGGTLTEGKPAQAPKASNAPAPSAAPAPVEAPGETAP